MRRAHGGVGDIAPVPVTLVEVRQAGGFGRQDQRVHVLDQIGVKIADDLQVPRLPVFENIVLIPSVDTCSNDRINE